MNVFQHPKKYLEEILNQKLINVQERHTKDSMAVIFFTKICKAGCPFCFFKSTDEISELLEKQELSEDGFNRAVEFINKVKVDNIVVSGGGEPFEKPEYVVNLIKHAKAKK